eukprot:CAMPEP_0172485650 /NCGR_PEP_ID=MMETSP1066-20121228/13770_1 /TAXON_ID=671091 /ORGANISM="Coscinodiscus wailesii, Strain CCMP2513" /LENGTH=376 /DNA_ID=CAMNT_0013251037 /DNA_START=171 /DNA_END=1301 /DNA_ORIENTATION=+
MPDYIEHNQNNVDKQKDNSKNRNEYDQFSADDRHANRASAHNQEPEQHRDSYACSNMNNRRARSPDADWIERYTQLEDFKTREGHCDVPFRSKDNHSLGIWVSNQRKSYHKYMSGKSSHFTQRKIEKLEAIGFKWGIKKTHDDKWMEQYKKLQQFKYCHDHCNVPQHYTDDKSLGIWVSQQRQHYKKWREGKQSNMTKIRIRALEEIAFKWNVKTGNDSKWMVHYDEIKKFKACKGHCDVPKQHSNNPSLRKWVEVQRNEYSKLINKQKTHMTQQRIELLNEIDFKWKVSKRDNRTWEKRYNELKEFKIQNGHCNVPQKYVKNPSLGIWVCTQRQEYKKYLNSKTSSMTKGRLEALKTIDFAWNAKIPAKWIFLEY